MSESNNLDRNFAIGMGIIAGLLLVLVAYLEWGPPSEYQIEQAKTRALNTDRYGNPNGPTYKLEKVGDDVIRTHRDGAQQIVEVCIQYPAIAPWTGALVTMCEWKRR